MPVYEFRCSRCLIYFEKVYTVNDDKYPVCPNPLCGCDKIYRIYNPTPIIFNANGFYSKDNK